MNKFLNFYSDRTLVQKNLIIIGISMILILFFAASYFLTTPSQKNTLPTSATLPTSSTLPSSAPFQTTKAIPSTNKLILYTNSYFSISYPDSLSYTEGQISGGGTSLVLRPKILDSSNAVIDIQTYPITIASQSAIMENVFTALNYQKNQITIANLPGVIFKGIFPTGKTPLRETAVIFTYQNRIYKLQLTYSGNVDNNDIEGVFKMIIAGFKPLPGQ
jgi:hypothetical protein